MSASTLPSADFPIDNLYASAHRLHMAHATKEGTEMNTNVITCDYMDEAPGHMATEHAPHEPEADLSRPVHYEDGDIERDGHACRVCGHVVADGMWHTDP